MLSLGSPSAESSCLPGCPRRRRVFCSSSIASFVEAERSQAATNLVNRADGSARQPQACLKTTLQPQLYEAAHYGGEETNLNVLVVAF